MTYLYLVFAIITEVIGTSLLPKTDGFTKLVPTLMMLLCYVVSFMLLSFIVKILPVGLVYAMWSAGGILLVSLVSYIVYRQSLDFPAMLGMAFIVAGVLIINLFSKSSLH